MAAAVILQDYLDGRRRTNPHERGWARCDEPSESNDAVDQAAVPLARARRDRWRRRRLVDVLTIDRAVSRLPGGRGLRRHSGGFGPNTIGDRLVSSGIVRDALTFRAALLVSGRARELKAGEYRFDAPMHALDVVDKIARGDVYKRLLTFREGLTITEMAQVFEEKGFGKAAEFREAAENAKLIADLDPAARDLEGYLFPETYSLPRDTPAAVVVEQMVAGSRMRYSEDCAPLRKQQGLTVRQVVTLASLVEKETAAGGGAAAGRRGLSQPPEDRHGHAGRSDGHLRACRRRAVSRQPVAREPAVRFALQHLSLRRTAAGPIASPGRPRWKRP